MAWEVPRLLRKEKDYVPENLVPTQDLETCISRKWRSFPGRGSREGSYQFPVVTVTDYHKFSGLKTIQLYILSLLMSEITGLKSR